MFNTELPRNVIGDRAHFAQLDNAVAHAEIVREVRKGKAPSDQALST
jgi:hypothetical protein